MVGQQEAGGLHRRDQRLRVAVDHDGVERRLEPLPLAVLPTLDEPEVEERHAAVAMEAVVPRVRVAVEHADAVDGVLGEAPDHLGGALLRRHRSRLHELIPGQPVDPLRREYLRRRQLRGQGRDAHPRMPGEAAGELGDVGRLAAVVEFLAHAHTQLVDEGPGVEAVERQRREHRVHHLGGVEVFLDRLGNAGELHLDGKFPTGSVASAVDLADARRRHRHVLPGGEDPLGRSAELALDHRGGERRRHWGGIGLQRGECLLGLVRQSFGDEADHLADLHQHALHLSQLIGHVGGRADGELGIQLGAALSRGDDPLGPCGREASGVAGREPPHSPRPPARHHRDAPTQPRRGGAGTETAGDDRGDAGALHPLGASGRGGARRAVGSASSSSSGNGSPVSSSVQ